MLTEFEATTSSIGGIEKKMAKATNPWPASVVRRARGGEVLQTKVLGFCITKPLSVSVTSSSAFGCFQRLEAISQLLSQACLLALIMCAHKRTGHI